MKYIDSDVIMSAMILAMYQNNQETISEDEALKFDMDYISGIKDRYFPKERLASNHITHKSIIAFCEQYPEALEYSFFEKKIIIKYLAPDEEAYFKAMLTSKLVEWTRNVNLK